MQLVRAVWTNVRKEKKNLIFFLNEHLVCFRSRDQRKILKKLTNKNLMNALL